MHRVVPELIMENFRAGRYSGDFRAVGMFMDLSGFSTMTDTLMQHGQHGAEVLAGLMHSVFDPLVESIFEYGGKIVGFAGDGIMALYPIEEDEKFTALRALSSALIIQQRLESDAVRYTVYGTFPITAKIGLTLGSVSWRILRSEDGEQATYYFRGSAVNDSAEAEHHARAGSILLTDELNAMLFEDVRSEPFGSYHRFVEFKSPEPKPTPTVFPPMDLDVARLFMPEDVIVHDMRGEFRQVVNLFMRFPDLPDETLHDFMGIVFELRKKYGGLLTRLDFGDKGCNMLMLWGAPMAYENDITRALHFVLDLQELVDFPITAGMTYYIAHAGYLGSAMCEDYTCYGWGVNLASRFMMNAPDSSVWIDERIARRVKNRFDYEYSGAQFFKGFATEQKVYSLLGRKSQEVFHQGELVGRDAELAQLVEYTQPLGQGKFAGMTVIWGDAGIGKSRLVYELKAFHDQQKSNMQWALCHSDQILRHSFNPFRYWLFRYCGIHSGMDDATQRQAFDSKLNDLIETVPDSELASELDRLRTVLGALLDLEWKGSFYASLDAEGRYNSSLAALIALIKAESLRQPMMLFIEDAQFLDEDSRAFLPRLKRSLLAGQTEYPIAILISSRHAGSADFLPTELIDHSIVLGPLSAKALGTLSEIQLGGEASPELVQLLEARSEGNPYFAEQFLIYLQEEKLIEMSDKGWRVARRLQDASLPADIRALLIARLDQLTRNVREVIQTAAVLGREFEIHVLAEMLQKDNLLTEEIAEAEKAEIWSAISQIKYIFSHGLLRDAAYAMQMNARRMELHAIALIALEKIYASDIEHHYGELAYHAEHARLTEKALAYLRKAGKTSADSFQNRQAVDFYTRALAFVPAGDVAGRYDIVAERHKMFDRLGKRDQQLVDLDLLAAWATQLNDPSRISQQMMWRSTYFYFLGNYPAAIEQAERAHQLAGIPETSEQALYTQVVWLMSLLYLGRVNEAMQRGRDALQLSRTAGNRREEGRILTALGLVAMEGKDPANAKGYLVESAEIAREIRDKNLETRALNNLAKFEGAVNGDYAQANVYYEDALNLAHEIGDRHAEGVLFSSMGFGAAMQGDFIGARSYQEQALRVAREVDSPSVELLALTNLSGLADITSDAETALDMAQKASSLARKISQPSGDAWALLYMGHAYLLHGLPDQAIKAYHDCIQIRLELNQTSLSMEARGGLVEAYLQKNDINSAAVETELVMQFFESGSALDGTDEPLRVYYACYRYLEMTKDPRAHQVLRTAKTLLDAQVSKFSDETARTRYVENIPWRRAIRETDLPTQR